MLLAVHIAPTLCTYLRSPYRITSHQLQDGSRSGPKSPVKNISFPPSANIKAVKLFTFFPDYIKSPDMVYRFTSNGARCDYVLGMVNACRVMGKDGSANHCARWYIMQCGELAADWTFNIDNNWQEAKIVA